MSITGGQINEDLGLLNRALFGDDLHEDRLADQMNKNSGAPDSLVKSAAKAASSGHWLDRAVNLAKVVKSKDANHLVALKSIYKDHDKLEGLQELTHELLGSIAFDLVTKKGWNKEQMDAIAWGLPLNIVKEFKLTRK